MRGLNHESDGTQWTLFYGENNLPNQQYCHSLLPRPPAESSPGADKDTLKHTILKHEAIFKDQVIELHRLYRVQKDLMYTIQRKEQYTHRIPYEASSSSSVFPLQTTPDDAQRQNTSSFLFTNSVCEGQLIQSSGGSSLKGKGIHSSSIPVQKRGSPRGSVVSESRPKKLRTMIDLELPADECVDVDEVEQQSNGQVFNRGEKLFPSHLGKSKCENDVFGSDSRSRKPCALVDLNEPVLPEETNAPSVNIFPWNSKPANMNATINSSQCNDRGNAHQWFPSMIKEAGIKDDARSIDQINHLGKASISPSLVQNSHQQAYIFPRPHPVKEDMWPAKANVGFKTSDRSEGALLPSQLPSYVLSSDLANSWGHYCGTPDSHLSQKSFTVQSLVHSNEILGNKQRMINQDLFYNAAWGCVNGSFMDKATSRAGNFSKGLNSIDLNDAHPNDFPEEQQVKECAKSVVDCELKREDPLSALPWLRTKRGASSNTEAASGRSGSNRPESHMPDELLKRSEAGNMLSRQNSVVASSCDVDTARTKDREVSDHPNCSGKILEVPVFQNPSFGEDEIESGRHKQLFDINIPCDDPEVFDVAVASEIIVREEKTETGLCSTIRNMFDLNSCATEDEIPSRTSLTNSSTSGNSMELDERAIIDLEAPINLENEEDEPLKNQHQQLPLQGAIDSSGDEEIARVAAEAIVSISAYASTVGPHIIEEASDSDDALQWFVDIVCSAPDDARSCPDDDEDCLPCESDYFEEMTLKLTECTVDEYFPNPPVFDIPAPDEPGPSSGRIRRGPSRRGRQRRDFQRDILPGLTSLARNEVNEDLLTFGGLMRATGHTWHCRNTSRKGAGRGRRKSAAVIPPPVPPPVAPPTGEIMLEDRSLSSWGKTTRRPRRQRCPSATPGNITYFALA